MQFEGKLLTQIKTISFSACSGLNQMIIIIQSTFTGRLQADFTGQRLALLDIKWDCIVQSTMTRAQETGQIIAKHLPKDIEVKNCQLIEEGAPIPPEPPVGHWRPEPKVRTFNFTFKVDRRGLDSNPIIYYIGITSLEPGVLYLSRPQRNNILTCACPSLKSACHQRIQASFKDKEGYANSSSVG